MENRLNAFHFGYNFQQIGEYRNTARQRCIQSRQGRVKAQKLRHCQKGLCRSFFCEPFHGQPINNHGQHHRLHEVEQCLPVGEPTIVSVPFPLFAKPSGPKIKRLGLRSLEAELAQTAEDLQHLTGRFACSLHEEAFCQEHTPFEKDGQSYIKSQQCKGGKCQFPAVIEHNQKAPKGKEGVKYCGNDIAGYHLRYAADTVHALGQITRFILTEEMGRQRQQAKPQSCLCRKTGPILNAQAGDTPGKGDACRHKGRYHHYLDDQQQSLSIIDRNDILKNGLCYERR